VKEVDFTDARLDEIVSYLSAKCDVNIVLSEEAKKTPEQAAAVINPQCACGIFNPVLSSGCDRNSVLFHHLLLPIFEPMA
jgi:hypothetical protein